MENKLKRFIDELNYCFCAGICVILMLGLLRLGTSYKWIYRLYFILNPSCRTLRLLKKTASAEIEQNSKFESNQIWSD